MRDGEQHFGAFGRHRGILMLFERHFADDARVRPPAPRRRRRAITSSTPPQGTDNKMMPWRMMSLSRGVGHERTSTRRSSTRTRRQRRHHKQLLIRIGFRFFITSLGLLDGFFACLRPAKYALA